MLDASNRRDWDAVLAELHSEVEIDDRDILDSDVSRGHEAYLRWRDTWNASWESWRMEDIGLREGGDDVVVALFRMVVRGRGSGIELAREDALVLELAGGKIRRIGYWNDQDRALEAAGLSR